MLRLLIRIASPSTHNIGFYEDLANSYLSIIIKYNQMHILSLLLERAVVKRLPLLWPGLDPGYRPVAE